MLRRRLTLIALLLCSPLASAKDKKKTPLPEDMLLLDCT